MIAVITETGSLCNSKDQRVTLYVCLLWNVSITETISVIDINEVKIIFLYRDKAQRIIQYMNMHIYASQIIFHSLPVIVIKCVHHTQLDIEMKSGS